jgi:hypothetical protein
MLLKVDRTIKIRNEDRVRLKYGQCFWMYLEIYVILKQNDAITDVNDAIPIYFDAIIFMDPIML